jgi:hypothetical protein
MFSPWDAGNDVLPLLREYRASANEYKVTRLDVIKLIVFAILVFVDPLWFFGR